MSVYRLKANPFSSHSLLLDLFPAPGGGARVLDVGCGDGHLGALLTERGYAVTGLERRGGYTEAFPKSVELVEADLEAGLPPLAGKFEHVLCADILEHLRRPESLLRELRGALAPGGRLVASLPNSGNAYFRLTIALGRFPQDEKGLFDRTHLRFYMWSGWKALLEGAGFRVETVRPSAIPVGLVVPPKWEHSAPVLAAESVCYGLARLRKQLFAYQFVVIARPVE